MRVEDIAVGNAGLFLLNVLLQSTLALGIAYVLHMIFRSRSAPLRYGILVAGLICALLAPAIASVGSRLDMGYLRLPQQAHKVHRPIEPAYSNAVKAPTRMTNR